MSKEYDKLNLELSRAGVLPHVFMGKTGKPIDTLVNTKLSSKPYLDILLRYIEILEGNEQEMVIRAVWERRNKEVLPVLEKVLETQETPEHVQWVLKEAIKTIRR